MLLLVYILNFLDRQILGILATPIKNELGLTDTQLGALGGIAFAALYSTLAIPLAMVADRTGRSRVIAISLAVWSAFTALCGLATGFWQLFALRLGVGIGEAGGVAPSYALIAATFPQRQRARALAIYSLGVPIGLALGALIGGYIAQAINWRTAFFAVGIAGVILVPVFRLVVRDPPQDTAGAAPAPLRDVFSIIARKPSFWLMSFAAAMSSACGYGLAFWLPSVLIRSFGFDLVTTATFVASLLLVGGTIGVFAGGWLADKLSSRDRRWYGWLPAIAWLVTAPLFAAALYSGTPLIAWLLFLIPNGLNILWLGPVTSAVQHLVPQHMRATASASFLLINNLIGLGAGSWVMGALSEAMTARFGTEALRYSTMAGTSLYLVAALLMVAAMHSFRRDWHSDTQAPD
jgi:predicted MFS family arabinose efflux permease